MTVTCISDTHSMHHELSLPDADVLVHAGDFTEAGTRQETEDFLNWFSSQPHRHKIFIAGNHDFYFEKEDDISRYLPENIHYLNDSGITIEEVKFWGSPVTPGPQGWAFRRERGENIRAHWEKIPAETDILISHTPPYKIMDVLDDGSHVGCEELKQMLPLLRLKMHIFGHLHNSYGAVHTSNTIFINASCLDSKYRNINLPKSYTI